MLRPKQSLTDNDVKTGLNLVIGDGLTTEAMTVLTSGTFLVAMAVLLHASNFQVGLLTSLPVLTNISQLLSIWLVRRYNNRRAVTVIASVLARTPLLAIGSLPFLHRADSMNTVLFFLFFYYLFGSIAGPTWNAWMKDLVPEDQLGSYFARRSTISQSLNVVLSIALALVVDDIKAHHPQYELAAYSGMFIAAGIAGLIGAWLLSRVQEPQSTLSRENVFVLLSHPLKDANFKKLLVFNSAWVFALNIATPFFTVFMMRSLQLPLSYIVALGILSLLASISTLRVWGRFADRYSNKTIIAIGAPLYIICIIAWCFAGIYAHLCANLILLAGIHILTGFSTAGINLALTNIGMKLAPKSESIIYLSAKNIVTAVFSAVSPLIGGYLADYFNHRKLIIGAEWSGPKVDKAVHLLYLHEYNFLFLIAAVLAFLALELLVSVAEQGEVEKDTVRRIMRSNIRNSLKDSFLVGNIINLHEHVRDAIRRRRQAN